MIINGNDIGLPIKNSLVRPLGCINKLCDLARGYGESFMMQKNQVLIQNIPPATSHVWFFLQGDFRIIRRSNGLVMYAGTAPTIFGMWELFRYNGEVALVAESDCTGITMPVDCFKSLLGIYNGWPLVSEFIMYSFHLLAIRDKYLIANDSYSIICYYLQEIMDHPAAERKKINIQKYIQERTLLSRSGILRIISELRKGDYIDVEDGTLRHIKNLPSSF